jgi:hypothetical protein
MKFLTGQQDLDKIMIPVSGYAALQAKASLIPYTFERRAPGDNDIVIELQYCGHTSS